MEKDKRANEDMKRVSLKKNVYIYYTLDKRAANRSTRNEKNETLKLGKKELTFLKKKKNERSLKL